MLKNRIIACLVVKSGIVVQSIGFKKYLPVGRVDIAVEFLNEWGVDEIVILDIEATTQGRGTDPDLAHQSAGRGFVPLTIGGGLTKVGQMRDLLKTGADKVAVNTAAWDRPELISEAAAVFGDQCVLVSIDARPTGQGGYEVMVQGGRRPTGREPAQWAAEVQRLGAGEILINSLERDGSGRGFDLELISSVVEAVDIPVIALGGVGHPEHMVQVLRKGKAAAAAAANFFHFTEHSVTTAKAYLKAAGLPIRLDSYANYRETGFDPKGRLAKRDENHLEALRFRYYPKEVI